MLEVRMVQIGYVTASGITVTAGLLYCPGKGVHSTAPIVRFMTGWMLPRVLDHCKSKNWNYTLFDNDGNVVQEKDLEGRYLT